MPRSIADEIVVRIRLDLQNLESKIDQLQGKLKSFESNVKSTANQTENLDRVVKAINFQTMAQGLLNVSSATVQVVTSFSSLQRVQNLVASSMVAVEKAEDQIARKRLQLLQVTERYGSNSQKAILITNELATAEEQLAVKAERLNIAQGNVVETQVLFISNLLNTGFGVMQTLNRLLSDNAKAWLSSTIATKLFNFELKSTTLNTIPLIGGITKVDAGVKMFTLSTKGATFAVKGFQLSLGVVGIALVAITTIMELWMTRMFPFQKEIEAAAKHIWELGDATTRTTDSLKAGADGVEDLSDTLRADLSFSLGEATTSMILWDTRIQKNILSVKELESVTKKLISTNSTFNMMGGVSVNIINGTNVNPLINAPKGANQTKGKNNTGILDSISKFIFPSIPSAYGDSDINYTNDSNSNKSLNFNYDSKEGKYYFQSACGGWL